MLLESHGNNVISFSLWLKNYNYLPRNYLDEVDKLDDVDIDDDVDTELEVDKLKWKKELQFQSRIFNWDEETTAC